jgi:hypothetical protein
MTKISHIKYSVTTLLSHVCMLLMGTTYSSNCLSAKLTQVKGSEHAHWSPAILITSFPYGSQAQYPYHQQQQQLAAAAAANARAGMDGRTTPDKLGTANSREQLPRIGGYGGQDGMGAHQQRAPPGHNASSGSLPVAGNGTQPSPRKREAGHQVGGWCFMAFCVTSALRQV